MTEGAGGSAPRPILDAEQRQNPITEIHKNRNNPGGHNLGNLGNLRELEKVEQTVSFHAKNRNQKQKIRKKGRNPARGGSAIMTPSHNSGSPLAHTLRKWQT